MFNMAHMGLRLAQRANGVSKLHGAVSRGMFGGLWEGFDADEVPIGSVTNGVHGNTWEAREVAGLHRRAGPPARPSGAPTSELWALRNALRGRLVDEVRRRVREAWLQRGASLPELGWTEHVFDPDVLTVGFARRVPTYKRLTLMLRDKDRLRDAAAGPAAAGAARRRREVAPRRRRRQGAHPGDRPVRRRPGGAPPHRVPARLRHVDGPLPVLGLRRVAEQPAAAAGGVRHVRDEVGAQRRAQPVDPRRLVGRALRRPQRLGDPHRRRHRRPAPPRRPGGQRALRAARHPGGARVLRADRPGAAAVGRAGAPHARHAAPAGAGHADGARVRGRAVRARRAGRRGGRGRRATRGRRRSPSSGRGWPRRGRASRCSASTRRGCRTPRSSGRR